MPAHRARVLFVVLALALPLGGAHLSAAADATDPAPTPTTEAVGSLRARPSPRPYANPKAQPSSDGVRGSRPLETTEETGPPRLDEPVLRWLPEITAASGATGTPISLIAGIMRVESGGDPKTVSPQGAQGLMQVMPVELAAQGIPEGSWHDPATNVLAGAVILAQRSGGGWEAATAYYFGIGCDDYGTCTYGYAVAVLGWANAYAALLGDPFGYDVGRIPAVPDAPAATAASSTTAPSSPTAPSSSTETAPVDGGDSWLGTTTPVPTSVPPADPVEEPTAAPTSPPDAASTPNPDGWSVDDD